MRLFQLGDQIAKAIMLKLAQQGMRDIGRHVATAGPLADLGGKSLRNGGRQLLSARRFTHAVIIPMVGSLIWLPRYPGWHWPCWPRLVVSNAS